MNKIIIAVVAAMSLLTVAGCKKKGGGGDAVAKLEGFQKDMCECKDKACADKVNDNMTKWGTEMANTVTADKDAKPDVELAKKETEIMTKYTECMTKAMTAGGPAMGSAAEPPAGSAR